MHGPGGEQDGEPGVASAVAEVVTLASELIALETVNVDDPAAPGTERVAAEYVAARLAEAGYDVTYVESDAPGRGNVVARLTGTDHSAGSAGTTSR